MSSRDLIGAETSSTNSASAASSPSLHRTRRIGHSFLRHRRRVHNTPFETLSPAQASPETIPIQMIILIAVFRFTAVEAKEVLNLLMGQSAPERARRGRQAGGYHICEIALRNRPFTCLLFPSARGRRRFLRSTVRRARDPRTALVLIRHS